MNILQDIVRAIGAGPLTQATEGCYLRAFLDPEESHPAIETLLHHLVATDHALLERIARSELNRTKPELVRRLVIHSYTQARSGKARSTVRTIANLARCSAHLPTAPGGGSLVLTESQSAALERLDALLEVYLGLAGYTGPVRPRVAPLIAAPSGSGKTFLTGLLARRHGLGLFRTSVSEWMVMGSKAPEPTLELLRDAIDAHPQGLVLHVDELDKLYGEEAWNIAQRGEIYACAGDRNVTGAGWTDRHRAALRDRVFVTASGTWQALWARQLTRHRGFAGPDLRPTNIESEIRASRVIPEELLFRWGPMIVIQPYSRRDFERIAAELSIEREFLDPEEAERTGLNFRAIELALTEQALARHHRRRRRTVPATANLNPPQP